MDLAPFLSCLSSVCFGVALVTARIGLRFIDARSGAAVSIPSATALFALATPFMFDVSSFDLGAALWFAVVGLFFPALVTILTFRSNETLGPTITATVSGTAPLFALPAAAFLVGESVPQKAAIASLAIVVGVGLISWKGGSARGGAVGWAIVWPIAGAVVRGLAQAAAKAGLLLWPNPFAAGLIGYSVSAATVIGVNQISRSARPRMSKRGFVWFAITGVLNGGAVLLMYGALSIAPVSLVAPIVATYPLVTAVATALVLREEAISMHIAGGSIVTVLAVIYLVW